MKICAIVYLFPDPVTYMTDFLKIAKSIAVHFAHICAYGVEAVKEILRLTAGGLILTAGE